MMSSVATRSVQTAGHRLLARDWDREEASPQQPLARRRRGIQNLPAREEHKILSQEVGGPCCRARPVKFASEVIASFKSSGAVCSRLQRPQPYAFFAEPSHLGVEFDTDANPVGPILAVRCRQLRRIGLVQHQPLFDAFKVDDEFTFGAAVLLPQLYQIDLADRVARRLTVQIGGAEILRSIEIIEVGYVLDISVSSMPGSGCGLCDRACTQRRGCIRSCEFRIADVTTSGGRPNRLIVATRKSAIGFDSHPRWRLQVAQCRTCDMRAVGFSDHDDCLAANSTRNVCRAF